jgi:hypothetical protein
VNRDDLSSSVGVGQEHKEGGQVEARRQRIDQYRFVIGRHLDQAELWPIGGLAQELGIHCHKIKLVRALAECSEHICGNYEVHTAVRLKFVNILPSR